MSSQNALQLATAIQSKVGSSLLNVNSMLPRPEAASATLQAGGGSLGVFLLRDLANLQEKTYECVEKVASILQSQLDLAEDKDRRERDQLAEELKERNFNKGGPSSILDKYTPGEGDTDELEKAIEKGVFADLLGNGLIAAMLAPGALKALGLKLGKGLIRGGIYASIAGAISGPIVRFVNEELDLGLDKEAQDKIELSMIGAGVGAMFGIRGAIIGASLSSIANVASYIAGTTESEDVSGAEFAATAIGSIAAAKFTAGKLGGILKGFSATTTLGTALASTPVILAVGAAIALGVGAQYIRKKIDDYQKQTLDKLDKTTAKLDKEMGEWAAREEQGLFERFGFNLGQLSALGEAKVATQQAMEELGKDKQKFIADTGTQTKLGALADTLTGYSDAAIQSILLDRGKAGQFLDTIEAIKGIAADGGFGKNSTDIFSKMTAFSDKIQNTAVKMVEAGQTGGVVEQIANNSYGRGGDNLEKMAPLIPRVEELKKQKAEAEEILRLAKLAQTAENEEQRKTFFGTLYDAFQISDTEIEQATRDAQKKLTSINSQLNYANDTLQGLGVNFTYDQLKELYQDNPEDLQKLIERSVNQQGGAFLNEQDKANKIDDKESVVVISKGGDSTAITSKTDNYIGTLSVDIDGNYANLSNDGK